MDNIRESIKILFNSSYLNEKINKIRMNESSENIHFLNYKDNFLHNYSSENFFTFEEVKRIESILKKDWLKDESNIFYILLEYTKDILIEKNNEILCKYPKLFKWRELTLNIGEDVLITSYLAYNDIQEQYKRMNFNWDWIIKTDNMEIRNVLSKGVAENHFHLLGSAPYFDVFWSYFMNSIIVNDCNENIKKYLSKLLKTVNPVKENIYSEPQIEMFELIKIAATIRYILYYSIEELEIERLGLQYLKENSLESLNEFKLYIISYLATKINGLTESEEEYSDEEILKFLEADKIEVELKSKRKIEEIDYIGLDLEKTNDRIYCSERYFFYSVFKEILKENANQLKIKLLYIYILIKNKLKNEVMYFGKMYSLDDFLTYNQRKMLSLDKDNKVVPLKYEQILYEETLKNTCHSQNMLSLEIRISIGDIESSLVEYDNYFLKEKSATKIYYTLHYNKVKDSLIEDIENDDRKDVLEERKSKYKVNREARKKIRKGTYKILELYEKSLVDKPTEKIFNRVLGIDAAGREMDCKPEVFGQAYRSLRKVSKHKKLWFTYHVGEDFIDLATGLRNIDEALLFLELEAYDRLGHALALGIEVEQIYLKRNYKMLLEKGELLDNISWLLMNIRMYNINFETSPKEILEIKYKELIKYIFKKSIDPVIYSEVWELRGDANYYQNKIKDNLYWEISEKRDPNNKNLQRIRKMVEEDANYKTLFENYFCDYETQKRYKEIIEFEIPKGYVELLKKIQEIMKNKVKEKKICIETNPTSNYLIAPLSKYENHPIKNFFNVGLCKDNNKCPQLHVSINTDDQGIFYTCLENEYALVALSLEKLKDENGEYLYNSYEIYSWLDKIREMGLQQSFANR